MAEIGDIVESELHGVGEVVARRSPTFIVVRFRDGRQMLQKETELDVIEEDPDDGLLI